MIRSRSAVVDDIRRDKQAAVRHASETVDGALDVGGMSQQGSPQARWQAKPPQLRPNARSSHRRSSWGWPRVPARARRGAISLSIASHFPAMPASYCNTPVRFLPGRAKLATKPEPIGSETLTKTIGIVRRFLLQCRCDGRCVRNDDVWLQGHQFFRKRIVLVAATGREAIVDTDVAALKPSQRSSACRNVARRACVSGSSSPMPISSRLAISRQAAALLPRPAMLPPRRRAA